MMRSDDIVILIVGVGWLVGVLTFIASKLMVG